MQMIAPNGSNKYLSNTESPAASVPNYYFIGNVMN